MVTKERFEKLLSDLKQPDAQLKINFDIGRFPNFFATWSPSISEGRVVKFLYDRKDIENAAEVPADFWQRAGRKKADEDDLDLDIGDADVGIQVVCPLSNSCARGVERDEEEDIFEDEAAAGATAHKVPAPNFSVDLRPLAIEAGKIRRRLGILATALVFLTLVLLMSLN